MGRVISEREQLQDVLYAIKGMISEANPEQQQAVAASRQLIAEMLDKYNDMGKLALQMACLELQIKCV